MELVVGNGVLGLLGVEILVDCERENVVAPVLLPYHGLKIVLDLVPILTLTALTLALALVVLRLALALVQVPLSMVESLALALSCVE